MISNFGLCISGPKGVSAYKSLLDSKLTPKIVYYYHRSLHCEWAEAIEQLCLKYNITHRKCKNIGINEIDNLAVLFFIGWQFLCPILDPRMIVLHDSLLPKYRGFAPTEAALINGEHEIGVSAITPVNAVDAGDIICAYKNTFKPPIKLAYAIELLGECYLQCIATCLQKISSNSIFTDSIKQNDSEATYSIWMDEDDMRINWHDSAANILRFIFALGHPLQGSWTQLEQQRVRVLDAELLDDIVFERRYPGKIWFIDNKNPVVVCGTGLLKLTECQDEHGETIIFTKIRKRFQ